MNGNTSLKFYPLEPMAHTPFWSGSHSSYETLGGRYLQQAGISQTSDPDKCDFFVRQKYPVSRKSIIKHFIKHGISKPVLVWTHEPRFCVMSDNHVPATLFRPKIKIMNVYARNLFLNNFSLYGWAIDGPPLEYVDMQSVKQTRSTPRQIAALLRYINNPDDWKIIMDGKNIDLLLYRQSLSLEGHKMGFVDIYGKNWPDDIAKEVSRGPSFTNWHERKIEILQNYAFNICVENTNFDYYCTEKIWDSIRGGCLPIYYGRGNKIYEDFPSGSFVDAAQFDTHREVIEYVIGMPDNEYCERMNRCIETYNHCLGHINWEKEFEHVMKLTVENIIALSTDYNTCVANT